ncbi:hypothetical protein VB636_00140, partial [Paracoccus sp. APAP_BH8]
APMPLWLWTRSGYLKCGRTLAGLARACGIDPAGLEATVAAYNRGAREGRDEQFRRGETTARSAPNGRPLHARHGPCSRSAPRRRE